MSNCQKEVNSKQLLKYKPYRSNFELCSKSLLTKNQSPEKNISVLGDVGAQLESGRWGQGKAKM